MKELKGIRDEVWALVCVIDSVSDNTTKYVHKALNELLPKINAIISQQGQHNQDVLKIIDYIWEDEKDHYAEDPTDDHIFRTMVKVKKEIK